jgi:hypothetical protein
MGKYAVWYDQTDTHKLWFEAKDLATAKYLLQQVNTGEIGIEELPEQGSKLKGVEMQVAIETLEEVAE